MNFFDSIYYKASDVSSLKRYLEQNIEEFWSLYYSSYQNLLSCENKIQEFILLKHQIISQLDFSCGENRSFVSALLDICLRLNQSSPIPILKRIIRDKGIQVNSRMEAGLSFNPHPSCADEMINLCDSICEKLQYAIDYEDDNDTKSIVTFLYYYSSALDSLHPEKVKLLRRNIESLIESKSFPFLDNISIILNINACEQVQEIIDKYYINERPYLTKNSSDLLIEDGTEYSEMLNEKTKLSFDIIRGVAKRNNSGGELRGRGVEIIDDESLLYTYLNNYGNMHKAKMLSALEDPFPQSFNEPVTIIDWGCGQALATMIFIDKYGNSNIKNIILIEPSQIAIKRAALHCKCMSLESTQIKTINKTLDDLTLSDMNFSKQKITINLFSNILDIDNYDVKKLADLIDQNLGLINYYVCVSPYIDDIKTGKIEVFVKHFHNYKGFKLLSSKKNTKTDSFWMCNNIYTHKCINHGESNYCGQSVTDNGCEKRWTRIQQVFKV